MRPAHRRAPVREHLVGHDRLQHLQQQRSRAEHGRHWRLWRRIRACARRERICRPAGRGCDRQRRTREGEQLDPVRVACLARLAGSLLYGVGEATGATHESRLYDLCARYRHAGFEAILSHVDDRTSVNGLTATHAATTVVAAAYAFSSFHVVAGRLSFDDKRPDNQDGRGSWLGASYRSGRHLLKAQWLRNQPRYGADNRTDAYGVGWQYEFSKRTAIYSSMTRFANESDAGSAGLGRFNGAIPSGLTEKGNNSLSELDRHVDEVFEKRVHGHLGSS